MRVSWRVTAAIIFIFIGTWFLLASSIGPFNDEPEHLTRGKAIAMTGSSRYEWDFLSSKPVRIPESKNLSTPRGYVLNYLCSWAFKCPGDPVLLCRLIPLIFTLLTFFIIVIYYHHCGIFTGRRLLTWAILFFGSSIVLDNSYYLRMYPLLAAAMTLVLILYWEGLMALRQNNVKKALFLWVSGFVPFWISVIDGWQLQQVPALALAIIISIVAFNKRCAPLLDWVRERTWWFLAGLVLIAPVATAILNVVGIPIKNIPIAHWFSTYWDNIMGALRVVLAVNIGLLAVGYAFKAKTPMTFDRWIFLTGFLSALFCTLYNPSNQVFFSRYQYFPTVLIIIGLSGILENVFMKTSLRNRVLILYVAINFLVSLGNIYFEHMNIRTAIRWLDAHMTQEDTLLSYSPSLDFNDGQRLKPMNYNIIDTVDIKSVLNLIDYIHSHPNGRIFFLYDDSYGFRDWLYQKITGVLRRHPDESLFMYLQKEIPSTPALPGLRLCGLLEFDRATFLKGLNTLSIRGFGPAWKAPEKIWIEGLLKNGHINMDNFRREITKGTFQWKS